MKAIDALRTRTGQALFAMGSALLALLFLRLPELPESGWAVYLTVGASFVTAQVALFPQQWRSRGGSLVPAACLVAMTWIVASVAVIVALLPRH